MKKNVAVILAGGSGHRMSGEKPKQFIVIGGKTILEHSLCAFQSNTYIDEISIVGHPAYVEEVEKIFSGKSYTKIRCVLEGGAERYHSSLAAIHAYATENCNLLIHDAVRPLVSQRIINDVVANLKHCHAVNVAVPTTDTIIEVDSSHTCITRIPDRSRLYNVQTPQGFDRETLQSAFEKALKDPDFQATDDCSIIKKYLPDEPIKIVQGEMTNLKLTWPEDISLFERLLSEKNNEYR